MFFVFFVFLKKNNKKLVLGLQVWSQGIKHLWFALENEEEYMQSWQMISAATKSQPSQYSLLSLPNSQIGNL